MSEWIAFESMRKVKGKTDFCHVWNLIAPQIEDLMLKQFVPSGI